MDKKIIFPGGGGGNHIRWLLFFDDAFPIGHLNPPNTFFTKDQKLEFIQNQVYPKHRTWYNWLTYEWQHRALYDHILKIDHTVDTEAHAVILVFKDFIKPIYHYWHMNLSLNGSHLDDFKNEYEKYHRAVKNINENDHIKILYGDVLFEETLDKEFLEEIADFYKFTPCYEYASKVHDLWIELGRKSAKDFYEFIKGPVFTDFLNHMRLKGQNLE